MSFRNDKLETFRVPMTIVRLLGAINEYKGKQELYFQRSPQVLKTLRDTAIIQSTRASNAIEGIVVGNKRLKDIMNNKVQPRSRSEAEIAGYRDVLSTIHNSYAAINFTPGIILQLHRDLYKFSPSEGGRWKIADNAIEEKLPDGTKFIRFQPVPAFWTSDAIDELCSGFLLCVNNQYIDPLLLTAATILDFLCIHPFDDGNGRMARLISLLLLYKFGYEVGRFISLEKIIEESKESYYETLYVSSQAWHEGEHDLVPWTEYFLGVVLNSYRELMERVDVITSSRGNKSQRVEDAIDHLIGEFSVEDLRHRCPDISPATIDRVLAKLRKEGRISPQGVGRGAKWIKR